MKKKSKKCLKKCDDLRWISPAKSFAVGNLILLITNLKSIL